MAVNNLEFLNKNQFRRYPLKADTTQTSIDGDTFSTELIVACAVSTTANRRNLYISQIIVNGNTISLALSAETDNGMLCLGRFYGSLAGESTTLELVSFVPFVSGTITLGSASLLVDMRPVYMFTPEATRLEESTVFYYTPPGVHAFTNRGTSLRGRVEFGILSNVQKISDGNNIRLGTLVTLNLNSLADQSSEFNNCKTPVIRYVDGAVPFYDNSGYYPQLQGNLFLVGVAPIVFYGGPGDGNITTQTISLDGTPLTLDTLCTARNAVLPPINPIYLTNLPNEQVEDKTFKGKENYYTKSYYRPETFVTASEPEFLSWPQFFLNYTKIIVSPATGVLSDITTVHNPSGSSAIRRVVIRNSGNAALQVTLKKNGINCEDYENINIQPYQAVTVNGAAQIPLAHNDNYQLFFNSVIGEAPTTVQVVLFYR